MDGKENCGLGVDRFCRLISNFLFHVHKLSSYYQKKLILKLNNLTLITTTEMEKEVVTKDLMEDSKNIHNEKLYAIFIFI